MNMEKIARGDRAKRLLELEEFREFVQQFKLDAFNKWTTTELQAEQELAKQHMKIHGLTAFVNWLSVLVSEGKFEQQRDQNAPES